MKNLGLNLLVASFVIAFSASTATAEEGKNFAGDPNSAKFTKIQMGNVAQMEIAGSKNDQQEPTIPLEIEYRTGGAHTPVCDAACQKANMAGGIPSNK